MSTMDNHRIIEDFTTGHSGHLPEVLLMGQVDEMDSTHGTDEWRTGQPSHFPKDLPERPGPPPASAAPWTKRMRGFGPSPFPPTASSIHPMEQRAYGI